MAEALAKESSFEITRELVEEHGTIVDMDRPACTVFKKNHQNICFGCPSEFGCSKALKIIVLGELRYINPDTRANYIIEILNCKTPEKLKILWQGMQAEIEKSIDAETGELIRSRVEGVRIR